ncbi:hypothetical protein HMPREF1557_00807 [Streptococcus sobrinus W1703]|uniref:Uncharacterized protein n=1 Tax=Streptococcus sobrinus W1703 TaxID=1227275 RepID=U2KHR5_9STRE|nr:hypothetical protein HMPREF1557_00807 [Streptococcus sobrinus W1703]
MVTWLSYLVNKVGSALSISHLSGGMFLNCFLKRSWLFYY